MIENKSFKKFAPAILTIYKRDKELFWATIMSQFLSDQFFIKNSWQKIKLGVELVSVFNALNKDAKNILNAYFKPLDIDINKWKSNRNSYFEDAYPIFAFLVVWMYEVGLTGLLNKFDDILKAGVFAVSGYGILDANVDGQEPSPVEILAAQALISEYETLAIRTFGITEINLEIMHKMRTLFLQAEIREKICRGKCSPYTKDNPKECGAKGANAVTPFMLALEQLNKTDQIDKYWEVFLLFGAAIQIIDDWTDLENDLTAGHYSYLTLGFGKTIKTSDLKTISKMLRTNEKLIEKTYNEGIHLINQSRKILKELNDPTLERLVDVTELRLKAYFSKELKMVLIPLTRDISGVGQT